MNECPKSNGCEKKIKGAHCVPHKENYLCREKVGTCPVCIKVTIIKMKEK